MMSFVRVVYLHIQAFKEIMNTISLAHLNILIQIKRTLCIPTSPVGTKSQVWLIDFWGIFELLFHKFSYKQQVEFFVYVFVIFNMNSSKYLFPKIYMLLTNPNKHNCQQQSLKIETKSRRILAIPKAR